MASIIRIKKSAFVLIFPLENNLPLNSGYFLNIFFLSLIFSNVLNAYFFLWIYTAWNFVFLFILEFLLKNGSKYFYKLLFPPYIFVLEHLPSFNNFFLYFHLVILLISSSSLILFSPVFSLLFILYFTVICIILKNVYLIYFYRFQ